MKKVLYLVLIALMLVTFPSCGKNNNGDGGEVKETEQTGKQNDSQREESKVEESDDDLSYLVRTYTDPRYDVAIDGPNWQDFFEAYSHLWNADSIYFIIFGVYKDYWEEFELVERDSIKTLEDIIPNMKEPIIMSSEGKSYVRIADIVITEQERVTVNGMETNRFEGYFDCPSSDGSINDRYIVGYTFFAKGEPGYLLGTVSSNDQEERYIEEVTKTVDDMIKTLRDVE
jgi:hypothetical protein